MPTCFEGAVVGELEGSDDGPAVWDFEGLDEGDELGKFEGWSGRKQIFCKDIQNRTNIGRKCVHEYSLPASKAPLLARS